MYDFLISYLYFTDLLTKEALVSKCKYTDSLAILSKTFKDEVSDVFYFLSNILHIIICDNLDFCITKLLIF